VAGPSPPRPAPIQEFAPATLKDGRGGDRIAHTRQRHCFSELPTQLGELVHGAAADQRRLGFGPKPRLAQRRLHATQNQVQVCHGIGLSCAFDRLGPVPLEIVGQSGE
jgi:hypothetical protein